MKNAEVALWRRTIYRTDWLEFMRFFFGVSADIKPFHILDWMTGCIYVEHSKARHSYASVAVCGWEGMNGGWIIPIHVCRFLTTSHRTLNSRLQNRLRWSISNFLCRTFSITFKERELLFLVIPISHEESAHPLEGCHSSKSFIFLRRPSLNCTCSLIIEGIFLWFFFVVVA